MTYEYEDFLSRMEELYPGIKRESLRKILREGLKSTLKYLRTGNDLIIKSTLKMDGFEKYWIKFYTPIFNVDKQYWKSMRDLQAREEERPKIKESLKKWKSKSVKTAKANKDRAKARRAGKPKYTGFKDLSPEEREKQSLKRRKLLRAARMRKIEEQKKKEQNNG